MRNSQSAIWWVLVVTGCNSMTALAQLQVEDPQAAAVSRLVSDVAKGNERAVREALANGVSPVGRASPTCDTPLSKAAELGRLPILKSLIQKADVNAHDPICPAALHIAALNGRREAVKLLLAAGAKPNEPSGFGGGGRKGESDLLAALRGGSREVVQDLLEAGASVLKPDAERESPLLVAAQKDDTGSVEILLSKGADPHLPSITGATPLSVAAANGNIKILQLLLAQDVNVDEREEGGITPLMLAVQFGRVEAVRILLDHGADALASGKPVHLGGTVLDVAIMNGQTEVARLLVAGPLKPQPPPPPIVTDALIPPPPASLFMDPSAAQAISQVNDGLRLAARLKQPAIAKLLLENGADVKTQDECGRTALLEAADSGDTETAVLLLAAGADRKTGEAIDALRGCTGRSALAAALQQGRLKMVNALLDSNDAALVNQHDIFGTTALDLLPAFDPTSLAQKPELTQTALRTLRQRMTLIAAQQELDLALAEPLTPDGTYGELRGRIASRPALDRIQKLAGARGSDKALRDRIESAAKNLLARWPPSFGSCPYGICSNSSKRQTLPLTDYGLGLSRDVLLLEMANRKPSPEFLDAVASDLDVKLADCESRGPDAGGESSIPFRFETSRAGQKVEQWTLFFLDLQSYALQKSQWKGQFQTSRLNSWASERLPPGNYLMFVGLKSADGTEVRTMCGWVDVETGKPQSDLM